MKLFPAIDLYEGKAVRLYQGDYRQMTVYDDHPLHTAQTFQSLGATCLHMVDLEGAKSGQTPNLQTIREIVDGTDLFVEVGGGIRSLDTIETYLSIGVDRVILGTAAVTDPAFLEQAVKSWGEKIAVGVDLKDGRVAIHGWTEQSAYTCDDFCHRAQDLGVKTMICTDVSRDGAMRGANRALYAQLTEQYAMDVIASGGVSSLEDVRALAQLGLYGAIIGKAYYLGAIDLRKAIEVAT